MQRREATLQDVQLPAPAARAGPDGLPERSVSRHADLTGLRAHIGVAPAAYSGDAWSTRSYWHQAPLQTTNAAPFSRHRPIGLTVDPVRFFLTMPSGVRWPLAWWTAQGPGFLMGDLNSRTDAEDDDEDEDTPPLLDLDQGAHQGSPFSLVSYLWHLATTHPDHRAASAA